MYEIRKTEIYARWIEYTRLSGKDRSYIKGQKYTLLSSRENLPLDGRKALKLLGANLLKESFGQLWGYRTEGWAMRFFDNWRESLKWQRLEPYEKFARMIERHWEGIAAYSRPENKVSIACSRRYDLIHSITRRASFISSCFVHVRKPDADIFWFALDITQVPAGQVVYIENAPMFVQIAESLRIRSILHTDYKSTCAKLASFGLQNDEGVIHETS